MFRDFIYLDTNRVQSILAQLEGGLITEMAQGRERTGNASLSFDPGLILKHILGLGLEASVEGSASFSASHNKVLHDYAFSAALEALHRQGYLLDSSGLSRDDDPFPLGGGEFVLVRGTATLFDYGVLPPLLEQAPTIISHWSAIQSLWRKLRLKPNTVDSNPTTVDGTAQPLLSDSQKPSNGKKGRASREPRVPRPDPATRDQGLPPGLHELVAQAVEVINGLFDPVIGPVIQITLETENDVVFKGNLTREFLREDIRSLIFKYGAFPQGEWAMLAQVSNVPPRNQQDELREDFDAALQQLKARDVASVGDGIDIVLLMTNVAQEYIRSVQYPVVAVAPIAVFRETTPVN
jgi:hypothetical protein